MLAVHNHRRTRFLWKYVYFRVISIDSLIRVQSLDGIKLSLVLYSWWYNKGIIYVRKNLHI